MRPARSKSLCERISASAGASLRVGISVSVQRMMGMGSEKCEGRRASGYARAFARGDQNCHQLISFLQQSFEFRVFTGCQFSQTFKPEQRFIRFFLGRPELADEVGF